MKYWVRCKVVPDWCHATHGNNCFAPRKPLYLMINPWFPVDVHLSKPISPNDHWLNPNCFFICTVVGFLELHWFHSSMMKNPLRSSEIHPWGPWPKTIHVAPRTESSNRSHTSLSLSLFPLLSMHIYIYIQCTHTHACIICVSTCVCVYVYIYIYRERDVCVYL